MLTKCGEAYSSLTMLNSQFLDDPRKVNKFNNPTSYSRAVIKGVTRNNCYELSMLDFPLMLQVRLPVVDWVQPQSNKFATGVENKATSDSKHIGSPVHY